MHPLFFVTSAAWEPQPIWFLRNRMLMSKQNSPGGKPLNLVSSYLLVPPALAQVAQQYTSANYQAVDIPKPGTASVQPVWKFKIRHDFGAPAVDIRGAVQNAGQ
jgi:hypothetical protein